MFHGNAFPFDPSSNALHHSRQWKSLDHSGRWAIIMSFRVKPTALPVMSHVPARFCVPHSQPANITHTHTHTYAHTLTHKATNETRTPPNGEIENTFFSQSILLKSILRAYWTPGGASTLRPQINFKYLRQFKINNAFLSQFSNYSNIVSTFSLLLRMANRFRSPISASSIHLIWH